MRRICQQNTLMFCTFDGPPNILRLYGHGQTVLPGTPGWDELSPLFTLHPGARQIIAADIDLVQTSCGYAVPLMDYRGERDHWVKWAETKGPDGLIEYRAQKNVCSLDDLPTALGIQTNAVNDPR